MSPWENSSKELFPPLNKLVFPKLIVTLVVVYWRAADLPVIFRPRAKSFTVESEKETKEYTIEK